MSYNLEFLDEALREWRKLDANTREAFRKKLDERLENPRIPAAKMRGDPNRYKIKLARIGYRLVYEVIDTEVVVLVIAIGRRGKNAVYRIADKR